MYRKQANYSGETEVKDASADLLQRVAQLEQQLKQTNLGGARAAPNSSTKSNPRRGRGWRSASQDTAVSAADAGNKPNPCLLYTSDAADE